MGRKREEEEESFKRRGGGGGRQASKGQTDKGKEMSSGGTVRLRVIYSYNLTRLFQNCF